MPRKKLTVTAPLHAALKARMAERDRLYTEVRTRMAGLFRDAVGDPAATLSYDKEGYASVTVSKYKKVVVGWPSCIPFAGFDTAQLVGNTLLRKLVHLLDTGVLHFESIDDAAVAHGEESPWSIHPDDRPPSKKPSVEKRPPSPPMASLFVTNPLVLRPGDLVEVGLHLSRAQLAAAGIDPPPHLQRRDTGKVRKRDLTNRYNRKKLYPRDGIKSAPYVLEGAAPSQQPDVAGPSGGQYWTVNDPLPEFLPVASSGSLAASGSSSSAPPIPTQTQALNSDIKDVVEMAEDLETEGPVDSESDIDDWEDL
ncbi:hypothetical protein C8Q77DRAFT_1156432 [Trametes polyzona]|nr:hypothetical protein C8Q77DRAFT_1156432 [Trametes polyzona]